MFAAEEIGCEGAFRAPANWFRDIGYIIEFDCPGRGLLSYTSCGVRLFANDGDFIRTALPALQQHGLTRWQRHPFTDVMGLRRRFDFSCLNLSCGYHNWHRPDECVVLGEVEAAIAAGESLVRALGCQSYPFWLGMPESAEPLLEVTGLELA